MSDRSVVADYDEDGAPLGAHVNTGTTAPENGGWVYVSVSRLDRTPDGTERLFSVAHLSPHRARTLAFDLLDAADEAEQSPRRRAMAGLYEEHNEEIEFLNVYHNR